MSFRIGTVDIPDRIERSRYFRDLSYLELSALFAGPQKPGSLAKWKDFAPAGAIGLLAPFVLTHRSAPKAAKNWEHDATTGDFRDSPLGRTALAQFAEGLKAVSAGAAIFQSPPLFAPSQANRDRLTHFFREVATEEAVGGVKRVWVPDGLWETRSAVKLATELGVLCAFDPLVRAPEAPPEIHYGLEVDELYLRITGLGRSGPIRTEKQEDLIELLMEYAGRPMTIVFESPSRWADARNLKKLLDGVELDSPSPESPPDGDDDES
ncbi:MAG: DUF72 domain-containing protein [Myxococcota bacterium]|nr:DUF72 domain-containing protein [Deltaproteobacteria bacterium]MDQ3338532.1 DUF72 domain-containing protein [Myxococcota bacterium]